MRLIAKTDTNFSIKYSGRADIKQHARWIEHQERNDSVSTGRVCSVIVNENRDDNNNEVELTPQEKVMKAEIIQALKVVSSNYYSMSVGTTHTYIKL